MARTKKPRPYKPSKEELARKAARQAIWDRIVKEPAYMALHTKKDEALAAWNYATLYRPDEAEALSKEADTAIDAVFAYERAAGLDY